MFSTAYLNILLSTVTAPRLMRVVLQFIFTGCHDNELLLDALVERVECVSEVSELVVSMVAFIYSIIIYNLFTSSKCLLLQLCSVSLELLYFLVDLNCEDIMLELILKLVLT